MSETTAVALEYRTALALERIATALEQMALDRGEAIPGVLLTTDSPPWPTQAPAEIPPLLPANPSLMGAANAPQTTVPLPPVAVAAPFTFTGPSAFCPVHRVPWKTVPAGTSKRTGAAYSAFLACPEMGCKEKPQAPR